MSVRSVTDRKPLRKSRGSKKKERKATIFYFFFQTQRPPRGMG